jgi:hypothetical protein
VVDTVEAAWHSRHGARYRGFSWSFTGDPTLPADGCRIRTEHGLVEAGFEDQLSEIATALDLAIPGYLVSAMGGAAVRDGAAGSKPGPAGHEVSGTVGAVAQVAAAPDLGSPDSTKAGS